MFNIGENMDFKNYLKATHFNITEEEETKPYEYDFPVAGSSNLDATKHPTRALKFITKADMKRLVATYCYLVQFQRVSYEDFSYMIKDMPKYLETLNRHPQKDYTRKMERLMTGGPRMFAQEIEDNEIKLANQKEKTLD